MFLKTIKFLSYQLFLCFYILVPLIIGGCGGGGGGGGTTGQTVQQVPQIPQLPQAITISGKVVVPNETSRLSISRERRTNRATAGIGVPALQCLVCEERRTNRGLSSAEISVLINGSTFATTTTSSDGSYKFDNIPRGVKPTLSARKGSIELKALVDVSTTSVSKEIGATSTTAFIIYEKLGTNWQNLDINWLENSELIKPAAAKILTNLRNGSTENLESIKNSNEVSTIITRLNTLGTGTLDTSPPSVSIIYPNSDITDGNFLGDFLVTNFKISFSYKDDTPIYAMSAAIKIEPGGEIDITSHFTLPQNQKSFSLDSQSSLVNSLRTLFLLPSNNITRKATITIRCEDTFGNLSTAISVFNIVPDALSPMHRQNKTHASFYFPIYINKNLI